MLMGGMWNAFLLEQTEIKPMNKLRETQYDSH